MELSHVKLQQTNKQMTRAELVKLSDEVGITLDGNPAILAGFSKQFMTVVDLKTHVGFQWSDKAVHRIITTKGGAFTS